MSKYPSPKRDEWVYPNMTHYKMACCDCGLVHEMAFEIVDLDRNRTSLVDEDTINAIDDPRQSIRFKVKRDNRATGQMRRHNHIKVRHTYEEEIKE